MSMKMKDRVYISIGPVYDFINSTLELKKRHQEPLGQVIDQEQMVSLPKLKGVKQSFAGCLKDRVLDVDDTVTSLVYDFPEKIDIKKIQRHKKLSMNKIRIPKDLQVSSPYVTNSKICKVKRVIKLEKKFNMNTSSDIKDNMKLSQDYSTNLVSTVDNVPTYENDENAFDLNYSLLKKGCTYLTEVQGINLPSIDGTNLKLGNRNKGEICVELMQGISILNRDTRRTRAGVISLSNQARSLTSKLMGDIDNLIEKEDEAMGADIKKYLYPENNKRFLYNHTKSTPLANAHNFMSPLKNVDSILPKIQSDNVYKFNKIIKDKLDRESGANLRNICQYFNQKVSRKLKRNYVNQVLDETINKKQKLHLRLGKFLK